MRALRPVLLAVAAAALAAACGYRLAPRGRPLASGGEPVFVAPLDDRTLDADASAFVTTALRDELARRDLDGGPGAAVRLEGVVEEIRFGVWVPGAASWPLTLIVSARLVRDGKALAEARVSRDEELPAGQDPLETEARRRLALRRAATAAARDLVDRLEAP